MLKKVRDKLHSFRASSLARDVRRRRLTYLGFDALADLERAVARVEAQGIAGAIIEAGCALGGSTVVIAAAKTRERPLRVYDVFGMIPPPSEADGADIHARYATIVEGKSAGIGGDRYYGYEENLRERVANTLTEFGYDPAANRIELIQGLFQDTMQVSGPVALAHVDADWYESVMTCLQRIVPHLAPGGTLVIDDYDHWSGCRRAVDEFFADKRGEYTFVRRARLQIVRNPPT
ncbi:MAG TPA: TylF/MycF/NovP-related O-methyltransferase [Longimicrobium sp.]|nr:TylF/MycF/NovP-related O-methyltransferase [Longimicrobium sp.]